MRRTRPSVLIILAVLGVAVGWLLETALAAMGQPIIVPPATLSVALVGIGAIVLAVGWPIRQVVRGIRKGPIDPFRAMRILVLAKASSLSGALIGGWAAGVLLYLASRPVLPPDTALLLVGSSAVAAVLLLSSGLVVEHWCRIPPSKDDEAGEPLGAHGE